MASQRYASSEHCSWWVGLQKRSIERGLAGRETQSLNIQQLGNRMQLNSFVCVCVHPCACICVWVCVCASVCVHLCVCICAQKIKCPDMSRHKRILCVQTCLCSKTFGMYYMMTKCVPWQQLQVLRSSKEYINTTQFKFGQVQKKSF